MKIERFHYKNDGYERFIEPEPCKHQDSKYNDATKYYECGECGEMKLIRFSRNSVYVWPKIHGSFPIQI